MNKIRLILTKYRLPTAIMILFALLMNKLLGKYLFLFLKTEKIIGLKIPFSEINGNKLRFHYNDLTIICRKYSSDINVFRQIMLDNEFNDLYELIKKNDIEIKTIVDLGANIGMSSLWFNKVGGNPKIYAVEPDTENFKILEENLRMNNINSTIINKGIWKDSRRLYFNRAFRDSQSWSVTLTEEPMSKDYIDSISIDDLIEQYHIPRIDILKMDIEGGESIIFNEHNTNLNFLKITKVIAIEIHSEFNCKDQITKILSNFKFSFFKSGEYFIGINPLQ